MAFPTRQITSAEVMFDLIIGSRHESDLGDDKKHSIADTINKVQPRETPVLSLFCKQYEHKIPCTSSQNEADYGRAFLEHEARSAVNQLEKFENILREYGYRNHLIHVLFIK